MRVFIVDSEPIFREGLKTIIRSKHEVIVAGEAGQLSDVLQTCVTSIWLFWTVNWIRFSCSIHFESIAVPDGRRLCL
jgi:hypothetical protein